MSGKEIVLIKSKQYVHIRQAAKLLGVSAVAVRAGCREGQVVCIQIGGAWYLEKDSLRLFLKLLQHKGAGKSSRMYVNRIAERNEIATKSKNAKRLFRVGNEISRKKK